MTRSTKPAPKSLRCAVYARVSSDKQDVENSLDRQLRACRSWAERGGHYIPDDLLFVDEAKSGASMLARPAFQRLLDAVRARGAAPFDAVLVDDDSRLDRGGKLAEVAEVFQARGIRLISVDSGRDLTDENERLLVHVKSGMNEQYLHELARRTRNGLASKVLHGFHAGGKTYGYRLVPIWPEGLPPERRDRENRVGTRIEIDEEQAQIVRRIFDTYLEGGGFRDIAVRLNKDGIRSSRGRPAWDPSGVRCILRNPRYVGDWSWNRRAWKKTPEPLLTAAERERVRATGRHPRRPTLRTPDELVACNREDLRIIPAALWEAVQARFVGRVRTTKGGRGYLRTRSPIAGILACQCGGNIGVHTATRKGHSYKRVLCAWNRNRGERVCANGTTLRMEEVAEPLIEYVRTFLLDPERIARAVEMVNRKIEERTRQNAPPARVPVLREEIARLEREVGNLVQALAEGTAIAAVRAALDAKDRRLTAARAELEALTRSVPLVEEIPRVSESQVRSRLAALWEDVRKLDGDRARLALGRIFDRITVKPLGGDWSAGWTLEMQTRPQVGFPEGAVVQLVGCGGPQQVWQTPAPGPILFIMPALRGARF